MDDVSLGLWGECTPLGIFAVMNLPNNVDVLERIARQLASPIATDIRAHQSLSLAGLNGSAIALTLAGLAEQCPLLCLMDDLDTAGYLYADLEQLLGQEGVMMLPSAYQRAIRYGHRDEANALMRSMALAAIATAQEGKGRMPIIVTHPEALAEGVASSASAGEHLTLERGATYSREALIERLHSWGYSREDYVYEPGQFAVRGSIIDVYSYSSERPYRLDFWDDELESMRIFEVESQLSLTQLEHLTLAPDLGTQTGGGVSLLEVLPEDYILVAQDLSFAHERLAQCWNDAPRVADEDGFRSIEEVRQMLIAPKTLIKQCAERRTIHLAPLQAGSRHHVQYHTEALPPLAKAYDALAEQVETWLHSSYNVYVASADRGQYERIVEILHERKPQLEHAPELLQLTLHEGFCIPELGFVLIPEHQIFGRYHKYNLRSDKARSGKMTLSLKELSTFVPGDLVVHSEHGIGRFKGLITMPLGERTQEVLKIEYHNGDSVYVGLHSLHKLSHYRQREGASEVALSKLGSGAWQRIKERTKRHVKDIARDLIRLYKARRESQGFAYSPDSYLQYELEASFAYDPTPDQIKATEDIKADMERPYPMDRLLCGDVGFGKTEVAIRAAFKAASDGKQVAVLVPTTVLAYQHYRTFRQRLDGFPVRVEYLSRARSTADTKAILKDLAEGRIDIIIGTHRLTSKDVRFRDLGLLIVDEEQKFGVAVKERLRKLQVNVDTLMMSATPIPRTLQFSLMGARDLSNINTPPANRVPVETILTRFSAENIAEAVGFELSRNGQVYVIHNRIQSIDEVAALIKRHVPDARIAIGHGQLSPSELERILIDFSNHDYDVLLATTIIENGIDVPNANTIIINEAHHYGLSELHQLRGRVGRSDRKAFCYLLTPPLSTLTDEARRRVKAIENFSDLGSGVRIALQDLDIRGAGNALGAEQSGFIADMGYETYQKVFNEAIRELKASEFAELYKDENNTLSAKHFVSETQIDSDLELSLPEAYVPSDAERIILYRELDELSTDEELRAFRTRLVDRFGEPPALVDQLIAVPRLRRIAGVLGIEKLILRSSLMSLHLPSADREAYYQSETFGRIIGFVTRNTKRCEFRQRNGHHIIHIKEVASIDQAIQICQELLSEVPED